MKTALDSLYSNKTASSPRRFDFNMFKGFFGKMKAELPLASASVLLKRTSLCASVATKVISLAENWQKTPLITGRRSSFPEANKVLLIARESRSPDNLMALLPANSGILGNSSPLNPTILDLPLS